MFAHVKKNANGKWETQSIKEHLYATANKAKDFASGFGNQDWAELTGLWHDLGKYLPDWQKYLSKVSGYDEDAHMEGYGGRPNHSTVGAILSFSRIKNPAVARIIAYIVAGHHAGLPDWNPDNAGGDLTNRLYIDPLSGILNIKELDQINLIEQTQEFTNKNLHGKDRANYGIGLLKKIALDLKSRGVSGCEVRMLERMRIFCVTYPQLKECFSSPVVANLYKGILPNELTISSPPVTKSVKSAKSSPRLIPAQKLFHFSWTHFIDLISVKDPWKRAFYENECLKGNWFSCLPD
ncbi:CRISPR-associated endonuclease Cas3'' [Candidatus Desantisbacteria bacterium]|nr:CRISPR-associated endonuclease Cas3'' [Candidatus Desantisbacteria bacterium]